MKKATASQSLLPMLNAMPSALHLYSDKFTNDGQNYGISESWFLSKNTF